MKTFLDNENRTWKISVNCDSVELIINTLGIDIIELNERSIFGEWIQNPMSVYSIIYVLVSEQCEKASVTKKEFGAALGGDAFDNALKALMEEIAFFFPQQKRMVILQMISKAESYQAITLQTVNQQLESITPEMISTISATSTTSTTSTLNTHSDIGN